MLGRELTRWRHVAVLIRPCDCGQAGKGMGKELRLETEQKRQIETGLHAVRPAARNDAGILRAQSGREHGVRACRCLHFAGRRAQARAPAAALDHNHLVVADPLLVYLAGRERAEGAGGGMRFRASSKGWTSDVDHQNITSLAPQTDRSTHDDRRAPLLNRAEKHCEEGSRPRDQTKQSARRLQGQATLAGAAGWRAGCGGAGADLLSRTQEGRVEEFLAVHASQRKQDLAPRHLGDPARRQVQPRWSFSDRRNGPSAVLICGGSTTYGSQVTKSGITTRAG